MGASFGMETEFHAPAVASLNQLIWLKACGQSPWSSVNDHLHHLAAVRAQANEAGTLAPLTCRREDINGY